LAAISHHPQLENIMVKINWGRRLVVMAAIGTLSVTAACGSDDAGGGGGGGGDSSEPLQNFMSQGETGLLAPSAEAVIRGAKAAVDYLNDNGGLHDRQIEVTVEDNQSDPTRGVTLIQDAVTGDNPPDLVIPGVSSNEALAAAPLLSRNKVIGLSPASSSALNDPAKYPYFFSQSALQRDILKAVATFLGEQGDVASVAFVGPDDALGDAISTEASTAFDEAGIEFTDHRFKADAVDVTPAFQAALGDSPDWIYMDAPGTQAGTLLSSRVKAGAEDVPTLAGVVVGSQPLLELAGDTNQMDNVSLVYLPTQHWLPEEERSDQMKALIEGIKAEGDIEVALSTYAAGWDSVMLWADAVKQVDGDVTAEAVRDALMNLSEDHDRLFYRVTYSEESNFPQAQPDEFRIGQPLGVEDGMFQLKE
jgi:branched-chain amino acid transport system substrate-binding protein